MNTPSIIWFQLFLTVSYLSRVFLVLRFGVIFLVIPLNFRQKLQGPLQVDTKLSSLHGPDLECTRELEWDPVRRQLQAAAAWKMQLSEENAITCFAGAHQLLSQQLLHNTPTVLPLRLQCLEQLPCTSWKGGQAPCSHITDCHWAFCQGVATLSSLGRGKNSYCLLCLYKISSDISMWC